VKIFLKNLLIIISVVLFGCGGGSNQDVKIIPLTDLQIKDIISQITLTYLDVYDGRPAKIRRYSEDPKLGLVRIRIFLPDASNNNEFDYRLKFLNSVSLFNQKLYGYLVLDVSNTPLNIDNNSQGYWRVSYDTAYVPSGGNYQSYCANVSGGPNSGSFATSPTPGDWTYIKNSLNQNIWWINLNNGHNCNLTQDTVTHEIAHALGLLGGHFDGFGNGPAISENMWSVLLTLYKNPNNLPLDKIVIYRN